MNENVLKNAIRVEQLYRLSREDKHEVMTELLKTNTQRGLAKELNIPHATIHDWATLRQNNKGKDIHISLNSFYLKLKNTDPKDIKDWGRLQMIKDKIEELIRNKNVVPN